MTGGRKTTLLIVAILDVLIIVALFVLRPSPGNTFDPQSAPLKELPSLGDKHVKGFTESPLAIFLLSKSREVVLVEDAGRLGKMVTEAKKDEGKTKQAREAAQRVLDVGRFCESDSFKGALGISGGLLLAFFGILVVGIGLPKNGTLLTILGGAGCAIAPNELAFVFLAPTVVGWIAMLVALARD